jgi:hypothetical protein
LVSSAIWVVTAVYFVEGLDTLFMLIFCVENCSHCAGVILCTEL